MGKWGQERFWKQLDKIEGLDSRLRGNDKEWYNRNMKKIIITVIVLVIFLGVVFLIAFGGKRCGGLVSNQKSDNSSLAMSIVPVFESDSFFKINAEYPQFNNADSGFNQKISDLINGKINDFKKDSLANWDARKATATEANPVPDNPPTTF
jgi:hypothetical protein